MTFSIKRSNISHFMIIKSILNKRCRFLIWKTVKGRKDLMCPCIKVSLCQGQTCWFKRPFSNNYIHSIVSFTSSVGLHQHLQLNAPKCSPANICVCLLYSGPIKTRPEMCVNMLMHMRHSSWVTLTWKPQKKAEEEEDKQRKGRGTHPILKKRRDCTDLPIWWWFVTC